MKNEGRGEINSSSEVKRAVPDLGISFELAVILWTTSCQRGVLARGVLVNEYQLISFDVWWTKLYYQTYNFRTYYPEIYNEDVLFLELPILGFIEMVILYKHTKSITNWSISN